MENFNYKGYRANNILKAFGQLQDIQKGEGSRGGKVIGHTSSGKPIYENLHATAKEYSDFTKEDHQDAHSRHQIIRNQHSHLKENPTEEDIKIANHHNLRRKGHFKFLNTEPGSKWNANKKFKKEE